MSGKICPGCKTWKPFDPDYVFRPSKGRFSSRCRECIAKRNRYYYERNRETVKSKSAAWRTDNLEYYDTWQKQYQKRKHIEWKNKCLSKYGKICACCGETRFEFLTLDHIDNDGHLHRSEIKNRSLYEWLCTKGFPELSYRIQTLCFNCNFGKRNNGGTCPHKTLEQSSAIS